MKYLLFVLLSISCVTTKTVWTKNGSSHQDFLTDKYECKQANKTLVRSEISNKRNIDTHFEVDQEFYNDCMYARGWRLKEISNENR